MVSEYYFVESCIVLIRNSSNLCALSRERIRVMVKLMHLGYATDKVTSLKIGKLSCQCLMGTISN